MVNRKQKEAERILAAMIYTPSRHGNSFDYKTADVIRDDEILEFEFSEETMTDNDYAVYCEIPALENIRVARNKTLGLFNASVNTMNEASHNRAKFSLNTEIGDIHYEVNFIEN